MTDFDCRVAETAVLLVDVQERFLPPIPAIAAEEPVGRACEILLRGAALLELPVLISEQYPQGLGPTLPYLVAAAPHAPRLPKTEFSVADNRELREALADLDRPWLVVAGIETHICILHTVDDLLRRGWRVAVAGDAVDSRSPVYREQALATLRDLGALIAPVESILFRLQRCAGVGAFKQLSGLVK